MIYNGPFVQKGWTGSNLSLKMVKNKYYWDKKSVKLNTITWSVQKTPSTSYNLYQSGKLDYTSLDSSQTKQLKSTKGYTTLNQGATFYMQKDISLAVNRKGLVSSLGGNNVAANTLTPPGLPMSTARTTPSCFHHQLKASTRPQPRRARRLSTSTRA
jgi:oligopeptide transport system substrate-binding protein